MLAVLIHHDYHYAHLIQHSWAVVWLVAQDQETVSSSIDDDMCIRKAVELLKEQMEERARVPN